VTTSAEVVNSDNASKTLFPIHNSSLLILLGIFSSNAPGFMPGHYMEIQKIKEIKERAFYALIF
jgi:hypothetical protein